MRSEVGPNEAKMSRGRTKAVTLSSVAGIAQRGAQVLSALIVYPVLTRDLGVEQFGIWGAATSLTWIVWTLDLGVGNALMTLIPRSLTGRAASQVTDIVASALAFTLGLSLIILAGGAASLAILTGRLDPSFTVAGAALVINIPLGLSGRLWLALQKGHVGSAWEFVQTCVTAVLLVAGARAGWTVWELVACVYGVMVAANGASLIHLFIRHPELRPRRAPPLKTCRGLLAEGGSMLGVSLVSTAGWALDNALTLFLLGPAASAWMTVALRLCTTAFGFISVISTSLWPAFAEAAHVDHAWVKRGLWRGGALLTGLSLAGSLALVSAGEPLLRWWLGRDLGVSAPMLWTVGAWVTAAAAIQAPQLLLLAVSQPRVPLIALTVATVGGFVLKVLLAPHFGPAGILAVNPAFNLLVVLPVCLWAARAWLDAPKPYGEAPAT